MDPIFSAQSKALSLVESLGEDSKPDRVKGLFGDALKWLVKNLGLKVIDWGRNQLADYAGVPQVKGLEEDS